MNRKNGVSMIVLSITILVMAILAATAIISLEDSGIIGRSKTTVTKQNYLQEFERLQTVKNGMLANNFGEITVADYIQELRDKGIIEAGEQTNPDDSITVVTKTGMVANLLQDGESNIIISLGTSNATIALNPTSLSGDITSGPVTKTITVNATNVTGDITWTTSNANVATVTGTNSSATVTLKGIGSATITATYGNAKATCSVNVTGTVVTPTITLNKTTISKTIDVGTTATETITATTSNISSSLVWTSSNTNVATVSSSGNTATITMKAEGTTIITAKSGNAMATCTVDVTENEPAPLGSLITAANYGDKVDYSVTVDGTTYSDWQIYYHNSDYVYLIAAESIGNVKLNKGTTVASLTNDELALYEKFRVGDADKYTLVDTSTDGKNNTMCNCQALSQLIKDYANFANKTTYGSNVVGAIGGPTLELLAAGWNAKGYTPTMALTTDTYGYKINNAYVVSGLTSDGLYVPSSYKYWLASPSANSYYNVLSAGYDLVGPDYYDFVNGVRPVVCLKSNIPATVGTGDYDFSLTK